MSSVDTSSWTSGTHLFSMIHPIHATRLHLPDELGRSHVFIGVDGVNATISMDVIDDHFENIPLLAAALCSVAAQFHQYGL